MTDLQRMTFIDHKVKGKRSRKIAFERQVTVGAVEKGLSKAKRTLRGELLTS